MTEPPGLFDLPAPDLTRPRLPWPRQSQRALEEIATSDAAAIRWWNEPAAGVWPQLGRHAAARRVDLDATEEGPQRIRARWSLTVTIRDIHLLRRQVSGPGLPDESFAELWNRAADPTPAGNRGRICARAVRSPWRW
jgi:hypothetical protein